MSIEQLATYIRKALNSELPGTEVQWEMASSDRRVVNFPRKRRADSSLAAVLILLYPHNGKIHTLFIERPVYDGVHSGQIAFPGGKEEEGDRDLLDTALREACEETAICGSDLNILGKLTPLFIPVSNIEVTPVLAYIDYRPDFVPDREEVVSLIEAELAAFLQPGIIKERDMTVRGEQLRIKYFDYGGKVIWGATAMILYELLVILEQNNIPL